MNLERITDYGLKASGRSPKETSKVSSGAPGSVRQALQDNFERNDGRQQGASASEEVRAFAEASPDIREEKVAEIREKIMTGFYHSNGFIDELATNLASVV